jgi:hypothetical protein
VEGEKGALGCETRAKSQIEEGDRSRSVSLEGEVVLVVQGADVR